MNGTAQHAGKPNALRHPLDALLGSKANVRLLRLLSIEVQGPVNAEDAARRTGLTPPGARKGLDRLVKTGFVQRIGGGRSQQFALRREEPLVDVLSELFRAEQRRYDELMRELKGTFVGMSEVERSWIDFVPLGPNEALELSVVVRPTALPWIGEEIRSRIAGVERKFDQVIEVSTYTEIDAPAPDPEEAIPVWGVVFKTTSGRAGKPPTHAEQDEQSLRMARAIARLLRDDPSMITRAKRYLDRQVRDGRGTATKDLLEWRLLLETYSLPRLQQFLVSPNSRATRLRQSSPFRAVLTAEERNGLAEYLENPHEPR